MLKKLKSQKVQLLIIIILTFLAYSNIFTNHLVIDDQFFIKEWPQMQNFDVGVLLGGSLPAKASGVYRPIRSLLYAFYYQIGGENTFIYHLHSILVHLAATLLVYFITRQLILTPGVKNLRLHPRGGHWLAFLTALLFGLHPIHTEEITYISASMDATGIVFLLASFYLYMRSQFTPGVKKMQLHPRGVVLGGSIAFALLAFFTNELTLILPVLIILYEIYFGKIAASSIRLPRPPMDIGVLAMTMFYFGLTAFYMFVRFFVVQVPFSRGDYLAQSFYHTMLVMPGIVLKYIYLLVVPLKLSFYHTLAPGFENYMVAYTRFDSILKKSFFDADVLLSLVGLIGLIGLIFWFFQKNRLVSFCLAWFFITMLPVSYIIPVGPAISERYLYLASFGFCLLAGYLMIKISNFKFLISNFKLLFLTFNFLLLTFYFYQTYQRNWDWQDIPSLYKSTLRVYQKSLIASYHLAVYYSNNQQFALAVPAYQKVLSIEPDFYEAHANLGSAYFNLGLKDEAGIQYQRALSINPNFLDAYLGLASVYKQQGKSKTAVEMLKKGLDIDPGKYKTLGVLKSPEEINIKLAGIRKMLKELQTPTH
ncbi:tetratricopeptide repeat protein [Candidatus Daviesbacteria bacterium]|nr:tetratricopeptide repeat protein [Candidatus Daviesbacteria bacterium]